MLLNKCKMSPVANMAANATGRTSTQLRVFFIAILGGVFRNPNCVTIQYPSHSTVNVIPLNKLKTY